MANHANLDTNAPHLASRGAFDREVGCILARVGCKLPWRGVHLAEGRGAFWHGGGVHFGVGGVHFQREGCIKPYRSLRGQSLQPSKRL